MLSTQLAHVDLGDPTQAEFSQIERTVQGWLRQVGSILCGQWAQRAADVRALAPPARVVPRGWPSASAPL